MSMAGRATGKNRSKCADCSKQVLDKESGVQCEVCEGWFHCRCQQVPEETYKFLMENESIHWYCSGCNRGVSKIIQTLAKIQERQEKMEVSLEAVKQELVNIKAEVAEAKDLAKQADTKVDAAIEEKLVEGVDKHVESKLTVKLKNIKDDVAESMEIEKRKYNLIFHGVKETVGGNNDNSGDSEAGNDYVMVE